MLPEPLQGDGPVRQPESRDVWFPDTGFAPTPVLSRESLELGASMDGPLIVEEMDSTIVVPPAWNLVSERRGLLELIRKEA